REEPEPGPQPGCLETAPGRFDEEVAETYDAIFEAAERHGVYVVPTLFAVGFTPGETWKSWEDNPYSVHRGGPARQPDDFFDRPELAERRLRYVLARWGYSPHLLAVDLLNEPEWDGGIGESTWIPWAAHQARVWHAEDPYGHPVMVGSVGLHWNIDGDDRDWYGHPESDLVQWHLYGKETYQVHALAAELTRKVRETWEYGKPVLLGEFGYGGDDPATYEHTHVGLWVTTFSGAGVLAHSAPPFSLDSDVMMTPERARHFRVLADYLSGLDWTRPLVPQPEPEVSLAGARAWALGRPDYRALWVMGPKVGYGEPVEGARLKLSGVAPGRYRVRWWDDVTGALLASEELTLTEGPVALRIPRFTRHVAGLLEPLG
ncbi:MAG TPA: cellulase family glycosylhydrolase, partial [Myxococcaceae bacterium]|nr:cellulase family glycosylhydrolase [Myxococcaceae bacterium]